MVYDLRNLTVDVKNKYNFQNQKMWSPTAFIGWVKQQTWHGGGGKSTSWNLALRKLLLNQLVFLRSE